MKHSRLLLLSMLPVLLSLMIVLSGIASAHGHGDDSHGYPVSLKDAGGNFVVVKKKPERVVSLVPTVTDIIYKLGEEDALVGVTYHSTYPAGVNDKKVVGGFFRPSVERIEQLNPDVIFFAEIQDDVEQHFRNSDAILIQVDNRSMEDGYRTIEMMGKVFHKKEEAAETVKRIKAQVKRVAEKVAKIPESKRKRVMRLMGVKEVMTPGDDSFQNEFIRAAGAIPPKTGSIGAVVAMSEEEWRAFDPQVVYYCGFEKGLIEKYLKKPGWRDVEAVKNDRMPRFPCELTCRASVHMGEFIAWLAATVYPEVFHDKAANIEEEKAVGSKDVEIDLDYVKSARIVTGLLRDFPHQTLLIDLKQPMDVINTLEGPVSSVKSVGNHSMPPPAWELGHALGAEGMKAAVCAILEREPKKTSLIFTGASMNNLSIQKQQFKDMVVYALITAGAESNAIRASVDSGDYYEPGTINIIILTNMELTPRAMARAVIEATEAKTAAVQDLDIRSCYTPTVQATGTGTDNMIVVQGSGTRIDNTGGHSKMGELIAKAVYAGVKDALAKQNGFVGNRNIFKRMNERNISVFGIATRCMALKSSDAADMAKNLEMLLLEPQYAGFIESAFALSAAYEKGLVCDLKPFRDQCRSIAERIAGTEIESMNEYIKPENASKVVRMAFDALIDGIQHRSSN